MIDEVRQELTKHIIPFWIRHRDTKYGGYYGYMGNDLKLDKKADKGCIYNNRTIWFFSSAYSLLKDQTLLDHARWGYEFLRDYFVDKQMGGVYWSVSYDGRAVDTMKHTYNQAFAIYALAAFYEASKDKEALELAYNIFDIVESKCRDDKGYVEAFDRDFVPVSNERLSTGGYIATRTMNTLLHVLEAYTELYRVDKNPRVKERLIFLMDTFINLVYNPKLYRQEVFFDKDYHSIANLHSYGHDIESSWLLTRAAMVLDEPSYILQIKKIASDLVDCVGRKAFDGQALIYEDDNGLIDTTRVWWVQVEAIIGFINGYQLDTSRSDYLDKARAIWEYIKTYLIDKREGGEWFWQVSKEGIRDDDKQMLGPWKAPYHNGRMCIEIIRRNVR